MDDLISRQWLMECVNEGWIKFDTEKDENRFIHLVRDIAPSAQQDCTECAEYDHERHYCQKYCDVIRRTLGKAKQERTGRWIHDGYAFRGGIDWMHCSECGHKDSWSAATRTPFCAWCGARMEGE